MSKTLIVKLFELSHYRDIDINICSTYYLYFNFIQQKNLYVLLFFATIACQRD